MNDQLKPIFEIVIPKITADNVKYWIYGGIANAAMVGSCYRSNPDVDLFVLKEDLAKTEKILEKLCNENGWRICKTFLNDRPKIEVSILKNGKKWVERLSVVPIYIKNEHVELVFREKLGKYGKDILDGIKRTLDNVAFYTTSYKFLKILFIEYLDSKKNYPSKRIEDARRLLTEEEFRKYFPNKDYDQNI